MTKLEIAKKATSIIVGLGTSKVVRDIINNNTQPRNILDQITIGVTSVVSGSMVAVHTKEHADHMIDEAVEAINKLKKN